MGLMFLIMQQPNRAGGNPDKRHRDSLTPWQMGNWQARRLRYFSFLIGQRADSARAVLK